MCGAERLCTQRLSKNEGEIKTCLDNYKERALLVLLQFWYGLVRLLLLSPPKNPHYKYFLGYPLD